MASFVDVAGQTTAGEAIQRPLETAKPAAVDTRLGLLLGSIQEKRGMERRARDGRVILAELVVFTRQLGTMVSKPAYR